MKKIMFMMKMTAAMMMILFAVSSFGGGAGSDSASAGGAKFVGQGSAPAKEPSPVMAWVREKAEAVLPEGAMAALDGAGSRISEVGGLAGVFSLAIPEESWQVFSNLDELL
jgi:hypothetical protein